MDALARIRAQRTITAFKAAKDTPAEDCAPCTAASKDDVPIHGLAALYDTWSSDGAGMKRRIMGGALRWDLEEEGIPIVVEHDGGSLQVVGRVDVAVNTDQGMEIDGRLFGQDLDEVMVNRIAENAVGWSIMMSEEEGTVRSVYTEDGEKVTETKDGVEVEQALGSSYVELSISGARVRHLAITDVPAFPGARPVLGLRSEQAIAAASVQFPAAHFERWESKTEVPLQVTPDGRVWGHAAGSGCYRTGTKAGTCTKYSADPDPQMKNFHTGTATLDNGEVIRVGALTASNLHATPTMTWDQQRQHHENTSTVWAKVVAWNDSRGRLCISGSVIPGLDDTTLAQCAGTPISVELWPVPGVSGLTLVAAHTVITPAWPVAASVQPLPNPVLTPDLAETLSRLAGHLS
jgi:hypothetical protein